MTDIELIKSKINIVDFISEYITVKKTGRNFSALCPFHSEKTPSFIVSPDRQSWYCFGACNEGGDIISFLEKWENIEFVEALKILAKKTGVKLSRFTPTKSSKRREKLYEINHITSEFFHYLLTKHNLGARAIGYLSSRDISRKTIETFFLGYSPKSWDGLIKYLTKRGYKDSDMFSAGLLTKSDKGNLYDRFRGRLMFPLYDPIGNIIGFSGRLLPSTESKAGKYINTPETEIYHKRSALYGINVTRDAIRKKEYAVVVEGEFDLLASFQNGVSNVVAIKGSALTEGQILLLSRYTENLTLALDSDFAGNEAAKRGIELADSSGMSVKVVKLPYGKDPAECIEKSPALWKKAVKDAVPVYDFIIDSAYNKYKDDGIIGIKKISDEVIHFIAKIVNPIIKSHYVKLLAKKLDVTEESIEISISRTQKLNKVEKPVFVKPALKDRNVMIEEHLLALIIQSKNPKESLKTSSQYIKIADFNTPPVKKIINHLHNYFKKSDKLDIKAFSKILTEELSPTFDRCFMTDMENLLSKQEVYNKELVKTSKEVKKMSLRRRIKSLSTKIVKGEKQEKDKSIKSHKNELKKLLVKLGEIEKS